MSLPGPQLCTQLYLTLSSPHTGPQWASVSLTWELKLLLSLISEEWTVGCQEMSAIVVNIPVPAAISVSQSDINWFYPLLKLFQIPACPVCSSWSIYRSVWKHFNFSPSHWLLTDFNFARFLHLNSLTGKRTSESSLYLTNDTPSTQLGIDVINILFCREFFLHNISNILIVKILPNLVKTSVGCPCNCAYCGGIYLAGLC